MRLRLFDFLVLINLLLLLIMVVPLVKKREPVFICDPPVIDALHGRHT